MYSRNHKTACASIPARSGRHAFEGPSLGRKFLASVQFDLVRPYSLVRPAAAALAKIGSREPAILLALKKVLRSRDYLVWPNAVQAVGQFHPFDAETLGLLNSLADIDPNGVPGTNSNAIAILNARMAARSCLLRR
jgi:hypothetical protein